MNKEEILAMEAGAELNALVAEKVMGLSVNRSNNSFAVVRDNRRSGLRPYSSDISAAWEVVEKMKLTHFVRATVEEDSSNCTIRDYGDRRNHIYDVTSDSITEAICKAALLAVIDS